MTDRLSEQETRSRFITPALVSAGWDLNSQIREELRITDGQILVRGNAWTRGDAKRADYVLFYKPNIPMAVIEAKTFQHSAGDGLQQALDYARRWDVPFAASSNGKAFVFHDSTVTSGEVERELELSEFPSPDELWQRLNAHRQLSEGEARVVAEDFHVQGSRKTARYYQSVGINRVVTAVAKGQKRVLLVLATGTGKTFAAFQIIWRLRAAKAVKRVLFLVDRNVLADQTLVNDFQPFGDTMTKVTGGTIDKSYEVYVALYQAIADGSKPSSEQLFRQFSPDFFDLVVIDECHRGSAAADSSWREILSYFDSAIHLGLTATPRETKTVSNIDYFGEPAYVYSLKQGVEDGFLAPFKVVRLDIDKDLAGWRPRLDQTDRSGALIEDRVYDQRDFDRTLVLSKRTELVAEQITAYLKTNDRMAKTIVFCENIDHAERLRQALVNANADIAAKESRYVMRITGDNPVGKAELDWFIDPESEYPVIVTTSKLMSTGVDSQTCKVIVLDRRIESLTEFKQIIGRGTRIREDYGKAYFTIIDLRRATEMFADPDFDGEPIQVFEPGELELDSGASPGGDHPAGEPGADPQPQTRFVVDDVEVAIIGERVQYYSKSGKLVTESLRDYTKSSILERYSSLGDFLRGWREAERKLAIIEELGSQGVFWEALAEEVGRDYDPFDLICHVAFDAPLQTRRERAAKVASGGYFSRYGEQARAVLRALLDKYADEGIASIEDISILRIEPFTSIGVPTELVASFGGRPGYEAALGELEDELYAA